MKNTYLKVLNELSDIDYFKGHSPALYNLFRVIPGYLGAGIRVFPDDIEERWKFVSTDNFTEAQLLSFLDFEKKSHLSSNNMQDYLLCQVDNSNSSKHCYTVFSSHIEQNSHFGDLILVFETDSLVEISDWSNFCDFAAPIILKKYLFKQNLLLLSYYRKEQNINFIHETQRLLNQKKSTKTYSFEISSSKKHAKIWLEEDEPIIMKFLSRFKAEFALHTVFALQKAAPGHTNCFVISSIDVNNDLSDEMIEMIEAPLSDPIYANDIISRSIIKNGSSDLLSDALTPLVFNSMASTQTFGHLGFFTTPQHKEYYLQHKAKLIPMLANQLGFFFSHFYQLRKEALNGIKLQQINQACNIVNSSVQIGAILFHLVHSLNNLFDQYSGAIVIYSKHTNDFEVVSYLGAPIPTGLNFEKDILNSTTILDILRDGSAFDNSSGSSNSPVRYILPMASAFQAPSQDLLQDMIDQGKELSEIFQGRPSLGSVILFDSPDNRYLSEEELDKFLPILLNGMGASLQVARNYEEKLDTIKALEGLINKISDEEALLDEMILIIRRLLNVNKISFLTLCDDKQHLFIKRAFGLPQEIIKNTKILVGTEISGYVVAEGKSYRVDDIETDKNFKKRSKEIYLNRSLLSVPLFSHSEGEKKVVGVINVNNKTNNLTFTEQDQQLLEAIAHLVAAALDNVRLMSEERDKELMERQLSDAKAIQMSLLPKNFSEFAPSLEIYGKSIPARQIGGDFFDILPLDDGRILIALGDVSGKGMPAAILMAVSRMILRSVVQYTSDVIKILEEVNTKLATELDDYHFVTFQVVAIDTKTGVATMSSAGHGPLMVKLAGKVRLIETKGGPPLGIPGIEGIYDKQDFTMKPGDLFISFTDGLSEEYSPSGEMFGTKRIEDFINTNSANTSQKQVEELIQQAVNWRARKEAHDDLTVLMTKYKG